MNHGKPTKVRKITDARELLEWVAEKALITDPHGYHSKQFRDLFEARANPLDSEYLDDSFEWPDVVPSDRLFISINMNRTLQSVVAGEPIPFVAAIFYLLPAAGLDGSVKLMMTETEDVRFVSTRQAVRDHGVRFNVVVPQMWCVAVASTGSLVRVINDPDLLLDWMLGQGFWVRLNLPVPKKLLKILKFRIEEVHQKGFLPAQDRIGKFDRVFPHCNSFSDSERDAAYLLTVMATELIEAMIFSSRPQEIYDLVAHLGLLAQFVSQLQFVHSDKEVRVKSCSLFAHAHGVEIDVAMPRRLRRDVS